MPVNTIRLDAMKSLTRILQGITEAEGYDPRFDCSQAVFRGYDLLGDDDPNYALSITEAPRPDFGDFVGDNQGRKEFWSILILGRTPSQGQFPTDEAYEFMAAVEDRLARVTRDRDFDGKPEFPDDYLLGLMNQGVAGFSFGPGVVRPSNSTSNRAFFYLPVRVELATRTG